MFGVFKLFSFSTVVAAVALALNNPSIEDFKTEAKKIIKQEQSAIRAGWSAVSKITGLNAVARATGMGNYELCRKNLYVASMYRVKNAQLLEDEYPVAVGIGVWNRVWILHSNVDPEQQSVWFSQLGTISSAINFTECEKVHNPGEF